jgi:hypothetical protein
MDLEDSELESTNWINLAEDPEKWQALVNAVMDFRVPCDARDFSSS